MQYLQTKTNVRETEIPMSDQVLTNKSILECALIQQELFQTSCCVIDTWPKKKKQITSMDFMTKKEWREQRKWFYN